MAINKFQLESILLAKAVKRFQRTPLRKIEIREESKDHLENEHYTLEVKQFELAFHHFMNSNKGSEGYSLRISIAEGRNINYFDGTNEDYLPLLKEIYKNIKKRLVEFKEQEKTKEEKRVEEELKKLRRIL